VRLRADEDRHSFCFNGVDGELIYLDFPSWALIEQIASLPHHEFIGMQNVASEKRGFNDKKNCVDCNAASRITGIKRTRGSVFIHGVCRILKHTRLDMKL
jgi:hypothetical protein